jgi:pyruvate kinase
VCTIGPASVGVVRELVDLGMTVARINFSHGTPDEQKDAFHAVRAAAHHARRSVAVMVDLPGPKIRLEDLPGDELELEVGQRFELRTNRPSLAHEVQPGDRLLLADGAVELVVLAPTEVESADQSDVSGHQREQSSEQLEQPTEQPEAAEATESQPADPEVTESWPATAETTDQPTTPQAAEDAEHAATSDAAEQPAQTEALDEQPATAGAIEAADQPATQGEVVDQPAEEATDQPAQTQPPTAPPEAPAEQPSDPTQPTRAIPAEVVRGGLIRSRAGVNVPVERVPSNGLTDEDRAAVPRALELRADVLAQSFVRGAEDVRALRALLPTPGPLVVAKIETRAGVEHFDEILAEVDGVMVARGDLGVDMPYEEVPARRPTRAEASDVANAVLDGTDAVMLSAETAIGQYPIDAAQTMLSICAATERGGPTAALLRQPPVSASDDQEQVCRAAVSLADGHSAVAAIWCFTRTGRTAEILSLLRPSDQVVAFTINAIAARRVAGRRGVVPVVLSAAATREPLVDQMRSAARAQGLLADGPATVVLVTTSAQPGGINRLELHRID